MDSLALVIFGITSNLAQIKLIPALYDMADKGLLPKDMVIIGTARGQKMREEVLDYVHTTLHQENRHHQHPIKKEVVEELLSKIHYVNGNLDDPEFYTRLKEALDKFNPKNKIFYLATYPELYHYAFEHLQKSRLSKEDGGFVRLMIEKPIGNDLPSAKELNDLLLQYFKEQQIYRLDHYLGKETLQNILAFRFGNGILEPLLNKDYIDHIQITASEEFGIGMRGGYFDNVGSLKDVGQNHQLQMLAFATMDAPITFSNEAITQERLKILKHLVPHPQKIVFGQYEGYKTEPHINPDSTTDTFYALKTEIDNERFRGVPIYIRAGKKLKETRTEIAIVFKSPKNRLLSHQESHEFPNALIFRIQPQEGIAIKILTKKPGHSVELEESLMQYTYPESSTLPDPYEKLISDAIRGDQTFFNDASEVEAQWAFIDPLFAHKGIPDTYAPGSWGPSAADELIKEDGRAWIE
jgi:glucose-6-phosphate 1-dehydrogenase